MLNHDRFQLTAILHQQGKWLAMASFLQWASLWLSSKRKEKNAAQIQASISGEKCDIQI